jgi:tRNA uridine 5-carbamoylmethylation protein Kti12
MKKAYVFRGPPGSGKGTLTKEIIKLLPPKVALLELDYFRWGPHFVNREVRDVSEDEHLFAYHNFLLMLESYCQNGNYDLVIEGLFTWDKENPNGNVQEIVSILKKYDFKYELFLLSADKETLWERNQKRKHVVPLSEFETLFTTVTETIGDSEIIIDVGSLTIEDSINLIKQKLIIQT